MSRIGIALLGLIGATTLVWSCVQSDNLDNDQNSISKRPDAGKGGKGGKDAKPPAEDDDDDDDDDDVTPPGDDDDDDDDDVTPPGDDDGDDDDVTPPGDDDGDDDVGPGDASKSDGPKSDAGTPMMGASKVAGSAIKAKCSSYGEPSGKMCAGYFCGVTEEDIAAELKSTVCPKATPESVCSGGLTKAVAKCARSEKTNPQNILMGLTDEQLRPKVQECVYKSDEKYRTDAPPPCIKCFLDAAQCASTHCLFDCLDGDSAGCDTCRQKNNCNQPVMKCAELPSPF